MVLCGIKKAGQLSQVAARAIFEWAVVEGIIVPPQSICSEQGASRPQMGEAVKELPFVFLLGGGPSAILDDQGGDAIVVGKNEPVQFQEDPLIQFTLAVSTHNQEQAT